MIGILFSQKHKDLKELVNFETLPKKKLSEFSGTLSKETAGSLCNYMFQKAEVNGTKDWINSYRNGLSFRY